MHVCVCMYVCMNICMHICMYACMYECRHVCMHVCLHVSMYVHKVNYFLNFGNYCIFVVIQEAVLWMDTHWPLLKSKLTGLYSVLCFSTRLQADTHVKAAWHRSLPESVMTYYSFKYPHHTLRDTYVSILPLMIIT